MDLHIRYEDDDDPKKCTAEKLERFGMAVLHGSDRETPHGVILNLHADRALSPADADTSALVVLDCLQGSADEAMFSPPGEHHALPYLITVNPMSFDRSVQLTTVEATVTVPAIFGEKKRAESVLSKLSWGHTFLELNEEPLRRYVVCAGLIEVIKIQREYLERSG